jgi:CHAD domain-containing protein
LVVIRRTATRNSSLAKLQDALGNLNDLAVAHQTLAEAAGEDAALAFRGKYLGEHDRDEARVLQKPVRAYKDWRQAKSFWH